MNGPGEGEERGEDADEIVREDGSLPGPGRHPVKGGIEEDVAEADEEGIREFGAAC